MGMERIGLLLLALLLAGCGAHSAGPGSTPSPSGTVSGTNGPFYAQASPAQLAAGSYTLHGLFLVMLPMGAAARVRENLAPLTIQILG